MKRLLAEPLLHFLLLGAALFVLYGLMSRSDGTPSGTIVVTAGQIEHLAGAFAQSRQRPPTDVELKGLIDDWVREEIATREAIAIGLDRDDTVIRRRLRQKLEFVSDDIAAQSVAGDDDLEAYLLEHADEFRVAPRFTFSQLFLDPTRHAAGLEREVARLLAQLRKEGAGADISTLGDSLMLEAQFLNAPADVIASQFGDEFAESLSALPVGEWQGPIGSGYGVHLVRVDERTESRLPELVEVRDLVQREWENARRVEGNRAFYDALLERYDVVIEYPQPPEAATASR